MNNGNTIILEDEKKKVAIAQLSGKRAFDSDTFIRALKDTTGVFTEENHPEWKTKKDVTTWLEKERFSFDRSFFGNNTQNS